MYWFQTLAVMPFVCLGAGNFAHRLSVHAARPGCSPSQLDRNPPHAAGPPSSISRVLTTPHQLQPRRNGQEPVYHRPIHPKSDAVRKSVSNVHRGLQALNWSVYATPRTRKSLLSGDKARHSQTFLSTSKCYQSSAPAAGTSLTRSERSITAALYNATKAVLNRTPPIAIHNNTHNALNPVVEISATQKILKRHDLQPSRGIEKNGARRFWDMITGQVSNTDADTVGRSTRTAPDHARHLKQANAVHDVSKRFPKHNPIDTSAESISGVRNIAVDYTVNKLNEEEDGNSQTSGTIHHTNYGQLSYTTNQKRVNNVAFNNPFILLNNSPANISSNINASRTGGLTRFTNRTQTDAKHESSVTAAFLNAPTSFLRKTKRMPSRSASLASHLKIRVPASVGVPSPKPTTSYKSVTSLQSADSLYQISKNPLPNTSLQAFHSADAPKNVRLVPRALQSLNLSPSPRTSSTRVESLATLPDWVSDPSWVGHMRSRREKWAAPSAAQEAANEARPPENNGNPNGLLSSWRNYAAPADDGSHIAEDLELLTTKVLRAQQQKDCLKSTEGCVDLPGDHMDTINGTGDGTLIQHPPHDRLSSWKTPRLQQLRTLPFRVAHRAYERYRPLVTQRIVQSAQGTVLVGNNGAQFFRNPQQRISRLGVGAVGRSVAGGIDVNREITEFNTQWKKFTFGGLTSALNHEILAGVGGPKGRKVAVDYSRDTKAGTVEVALPKVQIATLADFTDHDYGQRIRVKNYEISLRHDFDQFEHPDPGEYATEFVLGIPEGGVAVATDLPTRRYGVSVGVKNYQVGVAHDFNARVSEVNAKWGKGWKLDVKSDLVDRQNHGISAQVGFGLPDNTYLSVQGGLGKDGLPMGGVSVSRKKVKASVALVSSAADEAKFIYNLNIGKYTFGAESQFIPGRILIPNLLGIKPQQLRNFIYKLLPSIAPH